MVRDFFGKCNLSKVILITLTCFCPGLNAATRPATVWIAVSTAESPSARAAGAIAYDPVSDKIVLFGGFDQNSHLGDTWIFDGATWTQIATAITPPARSDAGMAFDSVTRQLVLFGGFDGANYLNDTWLWDGSTLTWTQAFPAASPLPATGPTLFADPISGHVDTFGGYNQTDGYQYTTWQWTGNTWSQIATPTSPYGRGSSQAVYDPVHKNVVLYGGIADVDPNNTWTFDGSTWTLQNPVTAPDAIMFGGASFDPVIGQVILFAGWGGPNAQDLNSTWAWNGSTWTLLKPIHSPRPREGVQMAYHQSTQQLIQIGGYQIVPDRLLSDSWKLVRLLGSSRPR